MGRRRKVRSIEGLRARCRAQGDCWVWLGAKSAGYGMVKYNGRTTQVHRVAYELATGFVPGGRPQCVMHTCNQKLCINPAHLKLGTHVENMRQAADDGLLPKRGHRSANT